MVLGFQTAQDSPSNGSPSPSAPESSPPSSSSPNRLSVSTGPGTGTGAHTGGLAAAVPIPELAGRHADFAYTLSHAPLVETEQPRAQQHTMKPQDGEAEDTRPPYLHCTLAGGLGGSTGDMLMHSLDTVKTRQQGDPHMPPKYTSLGASYVKIFRQEGIRRGLYGGWAPALAGSFPATCFFFGSYEYSKRQMLDYGVQPHLAYLLAGFVGDFAASTVYVPSEVVKTRMQLQGRYNNPHFNSGYNYRGMTDAVRTIVRTEGISALFHGYGATLWRDLPFSALQFMFYEQNLSWAQQWVGGRDVGWQLELLTGAAAGGLAGSMTCPLDVVKTRLQTQIDPSTITSNTSPTPNTTEPPNTATTKEGHAKSTNSSEAAKLQKRLISTSSPSTHTPKPGAVTLQTSSMITGLRLIYQSEGVGGWFRGVGPRAGWAAIQSGCMLFLYQAILRRLEDFMPMERRDLV